MGIMIFDMDGTLLASFPVHITAFQGMLKELYGKKVRKANIAAHFGKPISGCVKSMIEANTGHSVSRDDVEKAILVYWKKLRLILKKERIKHCLGVGQLIAALKKDKHTLVLMTGSTKKIGGELMKIAGLKHFFPKKFYGDGFYERKYLLAHTLSSLKKNHVIDHEMLVVFGDAVVDIEAGKYCNIKTVAVATGLTPYRKLLESKPDLIFRNFSHFRLAKEKIEGLLKHAE